MTASVWTWAWPWWGVIVGINVINFSIGLYLFLKSRKNNVNELESYHRNMRIAGIIFVGVAMYRSVFISNYLLQLAWFDTIFNSTLIIRFIATFAELAFAYLIMSSMLNLNKELPSSVTKKHKFKYFFANKAPYLFFIFLAIAQIFAYGGAITKVDLLFAIEETLWGLAFLSILPLTIIQYLRIRSNKDYTKNELKSYKIFTTIIMVFTVGYCCYSLLYHLPIEYWPQAIKQLQTGNPDPAFQWGWQAIKDTLLVVNVTRDFSTWGGMGFVVWHSGYFTLCGWMVLYFMRGPKIEEIATIK